MALVRTASPTLRTVKTDLVQSCIDGDVAGVRRALCSGNDPNAKVRGQTPLMYAAENGHASICSLLLQNGARVNTADTYNRNALHFAVKNLRVDAAAVLMAAGADRTMVCTLGGETPADIVHMRGTIEVIRTVMYFDREGSPARQIADAEPSNNRPKPTSPQKAQESDSVSRRRPAADAKPAAHDTAEGPTATSVPHRPPAPVKDELRRTHTPPRREV
jgi:hypothetical protein